MGRRSALRTTGLLSSLLVVLAACSVSTPRNGFSETNVAAGGQSQATGVGNGGGGGGGGAGETGTGEAAGGGGGAAGTDATGGGTGTGGGSGAGAATGGSGGGGGGGGGTTGGSGDGGGPVVGVTPDTITISAIAGFSGNYGAILTKIYENGFLVWVDEVNENGGINGRKVVSKKIDNKDTTEGGVDACKQVQNNGSFMAVNIVGFGGADVSAADCLDKAGITTMAFNLSSFSSKWQHVFSAGDPGKQTRPMASFIKNVIGEKKNVGVIFTNDPLNIATKNALVDELPKEGLSVVRVEAVAKNQGSFVAELNRVRAAGATTVALLVNTAEVVGILRDARAIGWSPNWTGNYWPTDENSTAGRQLVDGIRVLRNYSSTNSPVFPKYAALARKYGRNDVVNSTTMALYGMGLAVGQALQNAGANPNRSTIVTGIESMVNYNNGVTMALSFGKGVRVAEVGMWPLVCCNDDNTWKGIGDARSRF